MTNAELQALIDEFGDRICVIFFDNSLKLLIGYPGQSPQHASDLILKTVGGVDLVGVRQKSTYTKDRAEGVTYVNYHRTECIQYVAIMDEGFADYRIDPYMI